MKRNYLSLMIMTAVIALAFSSCSEKEDYQPVSGSENSLKASAWQRVFTDNFDNTGSWNNWQRTNRKDYNSTLCQYVSSNPQIARYDNRSVLVLTATKNGSVWNSGHVKSNYNFKPGNNEEYRVSAQIKLIAMNGSNWTGFSSTYGLWPAFWTVQENNWPVNGEIDIMEGYSYGGYTKFASNLFYGTSTGNNLLGNSCERTYSVNEGWHMFDLYWKNQNGNVTVTIQRDGATVATYTNSANSNLRLQNFGPHNIILNLCVGATSWNAFDNSRINVFSKTMMWVDYVTVDRRTL
jgi:hypothetical protein